jgi:hypothetical protein
LTAVGDGGLRLRKVVHAKVVTVDEELKSQAVNLTRFPIGRDVVTMIPWSSSV